MPDRGKHLELAAEFWRVGQPLEAGRLIFENLPPNVRPQWASRILRLVLERTGVRSELFQQVLYDADHQPLWGDGHRAFSNLRKSTLDLNDLARTQALSEELLRSILGLAELVAKVTYNAAGPPDEFDEDSGWWIAVLLRNFVDQQKDDEFSRAAWSALCFE